MMSCCLQINLMNNWLFGDDIPSIPITATAVTTTTPLRMLMGLGI